MQNLKNEKQKTLFGRPVIRDNSMLANNSKYEGVALFNMDENNPKVLSVYKTNKKNVIYADDYENVNNAALTIDTKSNLPSNTTNKDVDIDIDKGLPPLSTQTKVLNDTGNDVIARFTELLVFRESFVSKDFTANSNTKDKYIGQLVSAFKQIPSMIQYYKRIVDSQVFVDKTAAAVNQKYEQTAITAIMTSINNIITKSNYDAVDVNIDIDVFFTSMNNITTVSLDEITNLKIVNSEFLNKFKLFIEKINIFLNSQYEKKNKEEVINLLKEVLFLLPIYKNVQGGKNKKNRKSKRMRKSGAKKSRRKH